MHQDKAGLRRGLLKRLAALTAQEIKRRSADVEKILSELPIYKSAKNVMAFFPLKGEVDILGIVRKDLKSKRFCFPVMDLKTKELFPFAVDTLEGSFVSGPYGVQEPDPKMSRPVDIGAIDLVIVPGLAFDRHKNRLGRGAGFYDRFLRQIAPCARKVGVAFEFQILDETLPHDPVLDVSVDFVVSEGILV